MSKDIFHTEWTVSHHSLPGISPNADLLPDGSGDSRQGESRNIGQQMPSTGRNQPLEDELLKRPADLITPLILAKSESLNRSVN